MSDETAAPVAPAAAPVAAPAPAAPAAAPAPVATPAAPVAAPAPAAAAPAAFPAPAPAADLFADPADKPAPGAEAPAAAPAAAAQTYELKLPDGSPISEEMVAGVKADFAKANVPPDQAQMLFERHAAGVKAAVDSALAEAAAKAEAIRTERIAATKADPTVGGAKLQENLTQIKKGADAFLGKDEANAFRAALTETGAGNHPAVARVLMKVFSPHAPPTSVAGQPSGARESRTAATTMYPTQVGLGNANLN